MPSFSLLARNFRTIGFLFVCLPILQQSPTTPPARTSSGQSKPNDTEIYTDPDSYQIYAALLQEEKRSFYVIQEEINGNPALTARNLDIKGDRNFMRIWGVVMEDYAKQNRASRLLARSFPIDVPYEVLPHSEVFKSEHGQGGWDDFYRRYPSSGGFYWFSAVGFNRQKTRAIVHFDHGCGMLCGGGEPHFFKKKNGKWKEVGVNATIPVWAS